MLKIIRFEFKKIYQSTFFRFMLLFLFLFILVYYVYIYINTVRLDELVSEEELNMTIPLNALKELEERVELGELDKTSQDYKEEQESWQRSLEKSKTKIKGYKDKDWTSLLNVEINRLQPDVDKSPGQAKEQTYGWPTPFTEEVYLGKYKWMLNENVRPIFHIDMFSIYTVYDIEFSGDERVEEFIKERGERFSSSGMYYINHLFTMLFTVIGAVFFLFLFGDIVTKEGLNQHGSINFLQTQPIRHSKILATKFLAIIIFTLVILVSLTGISLILGTMFDRFGDWNYPILIYGDEFTYELVHLSSFLLNSVSLFLMVLFFCYSLLFLFSILTKRTSLAIGLTLVSLFLGMKIGEETIPHEFAHLNPFNYFSVIDVITQEIAFDFDKNFDISFSNGVVVLGIVSIIILALTYVSSLIQYKYLRR